MPVCDWVSRFRKCSGLFLSGLFILSKSAHQCIALGETFSLGVPGKSLVGPQAHSRTFSPLRSVGICSERAIARKVFLGLGQEQEPGQRLRWLSLRAGGPAHKIWGF